MEGTVDFPSSLYMHAHTNGQRHGRKHGNLLYTTLTMTTTLGFLLHERESDTSALKRAWELHALLSQSCC